MLGLFAVLIVLQGALRKWFFPGLSTPLYLAKDVALVGALILFGMQQRFRLPRPIRNTLLPALWGGFALVLLLQIFNPNFPSLAGSAMGARAYIMYTPLLILMPMLLERVKRPERWMLGVGLGIIVPVLILGIYQYNQPIDAWINQYVLEDQQLAAVAGRPRITGTFSYIGGMGAFMSFSVMLSGAMLLAGLRYSHRLYTYLGAGLLALSLIVAPMTGSRGVVLGVLVPLPLVLYAVFKGNRGLSVAATLSVLALVGTLIISESPWASQGWDALQERMATASDRDTRVESILMDPIYKLEVGGILGYGAGATHQAAGALAPGGRVNVGVHYEGELGRVIIELGFVGAFFFVLLKAYLAWIAWQAMIRAATPWETFLGILVFSRLFLSVGSGMIVFHHINSAIYWLCAGIAVWLWSRQEVRLKARRSIQQAFTS